MSTDLCRQLTARNLPIGSKSVVSLRNMSNSTSSAFFASFSRWLVLMVRNRKKKEKKTTKHKPMLTQSSSLFCLLSVPLSITLENLCNESMHTWRMKRAFLCIYVFLSATNSHFDRIKNQFLDYHRNNHWRYCPFHSPSSILLQLYDNFNSSTWIKVGLSGGSIRSSLKFTFSIDRRLIFGHGIRRMNVKLTANDGFIVIFNCYISHVLRKISTTTANCPFDILDKLFY